MDMFCGGVRQERDTRRRYRIINTATLGALALTLALTGPVSAGVYGQNTGAIGQYQVIGSAWDGLAGFQMLKPLTPQPGHGIAHPAQLNPLFDLGEFLGFGTHKGQGTVGGTTNCPTYTGSGWNVYVDGEVYGLYFCLVLGNVPGNAQSQSFIIRRHAGACTPYLTDPGWDVLWQGVTLACVSLSFGWTDRVSAGAENMVPYPGQAIGVTYVQLQYRPTGGGPFLYWPWHYSNADPGYSIAPYRGRSDSYTISP
jgi:hypothetical protein